MDPHNLLILIPTFNEWENIENVYNEIKKINYDFDILFIDDNSPDGTGDLLEALARKASNVRVIHRPCKMGIGSAHKTGIRYAYLYGFNCLITMDCDFSHDPSYITRFLQHDAKADVVIGSRYIDACSLPNWSWVRKGLTHLGHFVTKFFLKMPYDATGAYRLYRLNKINSEIFDHVCSNGYSFFFESLYVLHQNQCVIAEIPIRLPARTYGHSKMKLMDVFKSVIHLWRIFFTGIWKAKRFSDSQTEQEGVRKQNVDWDDYWGKKARASNKLYDLVAEFYRTFIIRPQLNYYVKKYFRKGGIILHAGCGSGQVDIDTCQYTPVIAVDLSEKALKKYGDVHPDFCRMVRGDVEALPFKTASVEGIYNLGVMEHFEMQVIDKVLAEFFRILKKNGKIIIFWPPEFGLSVIFLRGVHFLLNVLLKKNMRLHPDEVSLVKSKKQIERLLSKNGFAMLEYSFGPRDLFTYVIIVAQKKNGIERSEDSVHQLAEHILT